MSVFNIAAFDLRFYLDSGKGKLICESTLVNGSAKWLAIFGEINAGGAVVICTHDRVPPKVQRVEMTNEEVLISFPLQHLPLQCQGFHF